MLCPSLAIAAIEIGNTVNPHPGASDGMISVRLSGKASPFKIRLEGPVNYSERKADEPIHTFDELPAGTYTIIVIDKQGCQTTLTYELKEFLCDLAFNITNIKHVSYCSDNALCGDQGIVGCTADGRIEIEVASSNNYAVYLNGNYRGDNLTTIDRLDGDNYVIQLVNKSDENCTLSKQFQILFCKQYNYLDQEELQSPPNQGISRQNLGDCVESEGNIGNQFLSIETLKAQGATEGICNGELVFDIQANLDGYVYYIRNSQDERFYDVTSLSNLCPDNYCIVVDNGCEVEQICREIGDCAINPLVLTPLISKPCVGTNRGRIYLSVKGGKAPYTFNWSTGSTEQEIEDIPAGTYNVTVTDFNLCQETAEIIVEEEPNNLNVEIDVNPFSQYSDVGEIIITIDGPEGFYSLDLDGRSYGTLRVGKPKLLEFRRVSQYTGRTFVVEIFSASGCGFIGEVLLADCESSFEELQVDVMRSNDNACNGGSQLIDVLIAGGAPPYRISASSTPVNAGDSPVFKKTKVVHQEGLAAGIILAPEGRINIEVTDICGNVVGQGLTICDGNCWTYSEITKSDEIIYYVTDFLKFKVGKGCFDECGNFLEGRCSEIKVEAINTSNPIIAERGFALNIIWPDGDITDLGGPVVNGRATINGVKGWQPTSSGRYTIKVEWTPEDEATCTMEFDVEFSDGGNITYGFINDPPVWDSNPWKNAYYGTYMCESCLPSSASSYVINRNECSSEVQLFSDIQFFEYQPEFIENPCNGGGTLRAWTNVDGEVRVETIIVPTNVSLDGFVARTIWGGPADGIQLPSDQCDMGGRCLFDALDLFGVELPYPVGLGWCASQSVFVPPIEGGETPTGTTDEEDGFEDVWDEEDIAENCTRGVTVELDDRGCNYKRICHAEHGQEIVLEESDNEDAVTICRFITRAGNCASIRGRCNCGPEIVDGYEREEPSFRIADPTGELCDDETIISCQQYHIDNNCKGSLGIGLGGNLIGDTPPIDQWFLTSPNNEIPINKILYPNPFTNEININISVEVEKELIFSIMDIYGIVIFEDYKKLVSGQNTFTFHQLANYPNGIYYIAVTDDITGDTEVKKVIKASNY